MPRGRKSDEYGPYTPSLDELEPGDGRKRHSRPPIACLFVLLGVGLILASLLVGPQWLRRGKLPSAGTTVPAPPTAVEPPPTSATVPTEPVSEDIAVLSSASPVETIYDATGRQLTAHRFSNSTTSLLPNRLAASPNLGVMDRIGRLRWAYVDPQKDELLVGGDPSSTSSFGQPRRSSAVFLAALRAVYTGNDLGVSIDPGSSPSRAHVRYIGPTRDTALGWIMFEADRTMKSLSLGKDTLTGDKLYPTINGHCTMLELEHQLSAASQQEVRRRFWIIVDRMELGENPDHTGIAFRTVRLRVRTEYLDKNWQPLRTSAPDPAGRAFASQLTDHYADYAATLPIFADLEDAARWVALAHWLKDSGQDAIAYAFLNADSGIYPTPTETPALTVTQSYTTTTSTQVRVETLQAWGGVDLGFANVYQPTTTQEIAEQAALDDCRNTSNNSGCASITAASLTPASLELDALARPDLASLLGEPFSKILMYHPSIKDDLYRVAPGWRLDLPGLEFPLAQASAQAPGGLVWWYDAQSRRRVSLTIAGKQKDTGQLVYFNQPEGLVLVQAGQGFTLQRARFGADQSYTLEPGFEQQFDVRGWALAFQREGLEQRFTYDNHQLTRIQIGNATLELRYDSKGQLTGLAPPAGALGVTLVYDADGNLIAIQPPNGTPIYQYEYRPGISFIEYDNLKTDSRKTFFYSDGRVERVVSNAGVQFYDWEPDDNVYVAHLGSEAQDWLRSFPGEDILGALHTALRIKRLQPQLDHVLYLRKAGRQALLWLDGATYRMPAGLLANSGRLSAALQKVRPDLKPGQRILALDGNAGEVALTAAFPELEWINTEGQDQAQIIGNSTGLSEQLADIFMKSLVFIGLPLPLEEEIARSKVAATNPNLWDGLRAAFQNLLQGFPLRTLVAGQAPSLAKLLKQALQDENAVIIVVAHSDGERLYFPDGSAFSPDDLDEAALQVIRRRRPGILLISCETARRANAASLAKKLVDSGARFVLAPTNSLSPADALVFLEQFLRSAQQGQKLLQAYQESLKETYRLTKKWLDFRFVIGMAPGFLERN